MTSVFARRLRPASAFIFTLLAIEFLDELVFGAGEAAWPLIRDDLLLTYAQIGLLLTLPRLFGSIVEPTLGILGDVWKRRLLILGGGVLFTLSLVLTATANNFGLLLISYLLFNPSSGAFVSLSQSTLMDIDPTRHEQNMARWTFAGSMGVVCGSLALGLFVGLGWGWRALFAVMAVFSLILLSIAWRFSFNGHSTETDEDEEAITFRQGLVNAFAALRRREVLRWLTLLEFSNFLLDILYSYLALYFVDVVGVSPEQAALGVAVWTVVGLLGDLVLIPLLERVNGLRYLRVATLVEFILYPLFLLVPGFLPKLVIVGALGFFNAGSYAISMGQLYSAMPGQSGTALTVSNVFGIFASVIPLGVGVIAQAFGMEAAMWVLLLGPIVMLIGLPRTAKDSSGVKED